MAKAAAEPKPKSGGIPLVAILILTVLGGGAGAFFGMQVPQLLSTDKPTGPSVEERARAAGSANIVTHALAPITTNLASPPNTWVRLETAAVMKEQSGNESEAMIAEVTEDIVAFLRTVPLEQLEGPSGFQHLREDLNDRARVRSKGRVSELIVQGLVIE
jgi:flagellar protein FliL